MASTVPTDTPPTAEKPIRPTRFGSTRHFSALWRTSRSACWASATPIRNTSSSTASPGAGFALPLTMVNSWRDVPPPGGGPPALFWPGCCWRSRYFSTKAAMPLLFSHSATRVPSASKDRACSAPPGATTIAAPFDFTASGRYTVRVGSLTFVATRLPPRLFMDSGTVQFSEPGALLGHSRSSTGSAAKALRQMPNVKRNRAKDAGFSVSILLRMRNSGLCFMRRHWPATLAAQQLNEPP